MDDQNQDNDNEYERMDGEDKLQAGTSLREEILDICLDDSADKPKVLLELFRKWALEMVGEDDTLLTLGDAAVYSSIIEARKNLKAEIRKRIEEETK